MMKNIDEIANPITSTRKMLMTSEKLSAEATSSPGSHHLGLGKCFSIHLWIRPVLLAFVSLKK